MILMNIFFDKLMLQYIYCDGKKRSYYRKKLAEKKKTKNFLSRLLIADLKNNILMSTRRATSAC
jgi:hypothetical protein